MDEQKEVVVNPSAVMAHVPVLLRQILLVMAGAGVVIRLASARDMAGLWVYLHTSDFFTAATTAVGLVVLAYGQYKAHRERKTLVQIGSDPANWNVVVKEATPPPAIEP